eukprot:CAMPEP_0197836906 /NCGR_PEP_ID=MMETSP1437-20131217/30433_1 /TAXON_ID=49252 ORGANISM="Eucampia antarctica, Strain CCMP1452" /NCGR_SAMPLE_ID=MMETSP1437 /ASSEMBLY_ACC=CAM_ASM_001096 /LENGTH=273 /DNA_ID=CAMNT_0043443467 /DNA_START=76 /DNA_END=897 /DNA_ORIENTATION=+
MQSAQGFPASNNDDALNDLQFMTSIDGSIEQNAAIPPVRRLDDHTGGYGMVGMTNSQIQDGDAKGILTDSSHPIACFFHFLFKSSALFLYTFAKYFTGKSEVSGADFITITVFCILLLAADFWVVKNITGRLLVGLRWWNQVEANGVSRWVYESAETPNKNKFDNTIFWAVLYAAPSVWMFLFFTALITLKFQWLVTVSMGIALTGSNLYGYYKCSTDQRQKVQQMMVRGAEMGAVTMIKNNVFGKLANFAKTVAGSDTQPTQSQPNNAATYA